MFRISSVNRRTVLAAWFPKSQSYVNAENLQNWFLTEKHCFWTSNHEADHCSWNYWAGKQKKQTYHPKPCFIYLNDLLPVAGGRWVEERWNRHTGTPLHGWIVRTSGKSLTNHLHPELSSTCQFIMAQPPQLVYDACCSLWQETEQDTRKKASKASPHQLGRSDSYEPEV